MIVRRTTAADEPALADICLRTGTETGGDATAEFTDHSLIGKAYASPYAVSPHALGFVGVDDQGVAGYVVGTPDTAALERWCEEHWWPALRPRYPPTDADTFEGRIIRHIHDPQRADPDLLRDHPAHFHIDLLPRLQGHGAGKLLLTTMLHALAATGAPGVHLGVHRANTRAIAFYHRMGFTEHTRTDAALTLVRPLTDLEVSAPGR
ncbi:GNAT family N-acetyltransferase [Actinokineospora sp. G85]|uniref:GNAT family N-acetyltransferase n=1 Tax=Actinokineospora sp. G85 TaxID=3406626 RepID=UPI003C7311B3